MQHLQQLATDLKLVRTQIRIPGHNNSIEQLVHIIAGTARNFAVVQGFRQILKIGKIVRGQVLWQGDGLGDRLSSVLQIRSALANRI